MKKYVFTSFMYLSRKGTVADKMPDQIDENIKSERSNVLIELDERLSKKFREAYIGKCVRILTEEVITIDNQKYITGFTDTYVRAAIPMQDDKEIPSNTLIDIKVTGLFGKEMVIGVAEN